MHKAFARACCRPTDSSFARGFIQSSATPAAALCDRQPGLLAEVAGPTLAGVKSHFVTRWLLASVAVLGVSACHDAPSTDIADRVWISSLPRSGRDSFAAVVLTQRAGRGVGAFFNGSFYRGGYDLFSWKTAGVNRYQLDLLQTQTKSELRAEPCTPQAGFDYCVRLIGDPSGQVRYQSRKRWTFRKKPKTGSELQEAVRETLEQDEELAGLLQDET